MASTERLHPVLLTVAEIAFLREALDSHEYWQLSDPNERNDGYSTVKDGEDEGIDACRALDRALHKALAEIEGTGPASR